MSSCINNMLNSKWTQFFEHQKIDKKENSIKIKLTKSNWELKTRLRLNSKKILWSNILFVLRKKINWSNSLHFHHSWFRCSKSQKQIFNVHKRHVEHQTFASQKNLQSHQWNDKIEELTKRNREKSQKSENQQNLWHLDCHLKRSCNIKWIWTLLCQ